MCHYHMCAIVRRKITKNPKLLAGQELQQLMRTLKDAKEDDFKRDCGAKVIASVDIDKLHTTISACNLTY